MVEMLLINIILVLVYVLRQHVRRHKEADRKAAELMKEWQDIKARHSYTKEERQELRRMKYEYTSYGNGYSLAAA
jgi:hypothetical protein